MSENDTNQRDGNTEQVKPDKCADILQATFKHYFEMAMDHHTKAGTTSNILLLIVAAIITLIGHDEISGIVDSMSGLAVFIIGIFGAVWAWKQHERYHFWQNIADEYHKELKKMVPVLKTRDEYQEGATAKAADEFGPLFAKRILDRYLWVSLHLIVALLGIALLLAALI